MIYNIPNRSFKGIELAILLVNNFPTVQGKQKIGFIVPIKKKASQIKFYLKKIFKLIKKIPEFVHMLKTNP